MRLFDGVVALMTATVLIGGAFAGPATAAASQAGGRGVASVQVAAPLRTLISRLPVVAPSHVSSYSRTRDFGDWTEHSTKYGECNTHALVLITESLKATTRNSYCTVSYGRWYSWYNDVYYTDAYGGRTLQIDRLVPVENAWQSGAWRWTKATRIRFYNDLGDSRSLNAVDTHDNEVKQASPPQDWMPRFHRCRYITDWVAVKTRWHLNTTTTEKAYLAKVARGCSNTTVRVTKAGIAYS